MAEVLEKFPRYGAVYDYESGVFVRTATRGDLLLTLRSMRDFAHGDPNGAWSDPESGRLVFVADEQPEAVSELIAEHDLDAQVSAMFGGQ